MRFLYILFLIILFHTGVYSQVITKGLELSVVERIVKDGCTYDRLLKRMQLADPDLTTEEYQILYYGFQFRDEYRGSLDTNHHYITNLVEKGQYREAFNNARKALDLNPVSLRLLLYCIQTGRELGMSKEELAPFTVPFLELTYVIALSGDGKTDRTAFKVITITDEYVMMQFNFNITDIKEQKFMERLGRYYDYFIVTPTEEYNAKVIYFDITPSMLKMNEAYGYE